MDQLRSLCSKKVSIFSQNIVFHPEMTFLFYYPVKLILRSQLKVPIDTCCWEILFIFIDEKNASLCENF